MMLESQTRSSITVLKLDLLPQLLTRFPNLVSFRTCKPITDSDQLKLVAKACPKPQTLILDYIDRDSILEKRQEFLAAAPGENLELSRNNIDPSEGRRQRSVCCCKWVSQIVQDCVQGKNDHVLEAIGSCPISFLSLQSTRAFLADGSCSQTIKHLDLGSCRKITDFGVSLFRKMKVLEALNLEGCRNLTDVGGGAISAMLILKKLNLGKLWYETDCTIVAIAKNCLNLEKLSLNLTARVLTREGIQSFCGHKHLDKIEGYDLKRLALLCPSLVSISLEKRLRRRLCVEMSIMSSDDGVRLDCDLLRDGD